MCVSGACVCAGAGGGSGGTATGASSIGLLARLAMIVSARRRRRVRGMGRHAPALLGRSPSATLTATRAGYGEGPAASHAAGRPSQPARPVPFPSQRDAPAGQAGRPPAGPPPRRRRRVRLYVGETVGAPGSRSTSNSLTSAPARAATPRPALTRPVQAGRVRPTMGRSAAPAGIGHTALARRSEDQPEPAPPERPPRGGRVLRLYDVHLRRRRGRLGRRASGR
jgi:hypothetical protein